MSSPGQEDSPGAPVGRLLAIALVLAGVTLFFSQGWYRQLDLAALQASRSQLVAWRQAAPLATAAAYLLVYVLATGLSLPGATVLTLAGGAVFGLLQGTLLVSLGSTLGATVACLLARTLLREPVRRRFGSRLGPIEAGVRRDGASYLLSLRLVPVVPFFLVNLLMGLTPMPLRSFAFVSQLGMLPATLVYVNAGTQLGQLTGLKGLLSPALLGSFALLGLLPWIVKLLQGRWRLWRLYRPWSRPRHFDRNLIVIGAGAAGLVTAYIAATVRAKVTLIERARMGGDCLNTGCVPSKALISSARLAARLRHADRYGLSPMEPQVDLRRVLERVRQKVAAIAPHDSVERYTALGVDVRLGQARLVSPWEVAITAADGSETVLSARAIVLATGAAPVIPAVPGIASVRVLTSETLWDALAEHPSPRPSLVVLGGGPIGCELAQALAQLGLPVTLLQRNTRLLPREDPEVGALLREVLERDGVRVHTGCRMERVKSTAAGGVQVHFQDGGGGGGVEADELLCAVGRQARLEGHGLEALGIPTGRTIDTSPHLQTLYPNIYAAGDAAGPWQFTHTAAHQAWYAAVNGLFDPVRFAVDGRVIPRTTFTDPEVARVGLSESEAMEQGVAFEVTRFDLAELDRAIVESAETGFVKVLTVPGKDRILGVTIVAEQAGELLAEFVLAMKWNLGLGKVMGAIHAYPTLAEANKYAAGAWKKAHAPQRTLALLERFHTWRRGGG
ncbi:MULTISPECIES: FAD-dependent oxidoreductase [unclassified Cyanobium]|uniref:FAD-dependent oxidoreductase n=1 Tax=unclassified Cyanobium TaxID=2627006 RepID=UPI0020CC9397|nr:MULTISPECIES: bifunctional TVP38/TMEM64 family protein/FAD-dependent oxidoreductase [unclassified Cyanobium]MCP9834577.1 FAD-dependent oxidoreductase [Cyanobium sp. La Preciosa 7G6]MCP9937340.1 FAD-dependent oxidoreductase [Cyanobium sp. Aljojuca 7A6]